MTNGRRNSTHPVRPIGLNRRRFVKNLSLGVSGAAFASPLGLAPWPTMAAGTPLTYAFWPFGDQILADNARIFTEQYGWPVTLQPIPGDYTSALETKLAAHQPFDLFRAQRGQASRWFAAKWIRPIDDLPDLGKIQKEEFPGIVTDSRSWPDHKCIGLTYYNGGPFCLFRNEKVLAAGGYKATANPDDYPKSWNEIYKQAVDLKKRGIVANPILPCWFKSWTGTPWALYAQCYSEGETLVDDDMKATFSLNTPLLKVLSDWKRWWDEDLVPKAILSWQEPQMQDSWMKGLHAFHFYTDYNSFLYSDPKNSTFAEYFNMNPQVPGETHQTTLVGHALHCMTNTRRTDDEVMRAWQLMKFFSWRDKTGVFRIPTAWARLANLEVPFPAVYDEPEVKAAIMKWMYPPLARENYNWLFEGRRKALAGKQLKAPWLQQWEVATEQMIENELLLKGAMKPTEVVTSMRDRWEKLRSKYAKVLQSTSKVKL